MAKLKLVDSGTISVYDASGNIKCPIEATKGNWITWKRNGTRGNFKAKIVGFSDAKPGYVFIQNTINYWATDVGHPVWIKIRSISHKVKGNGDYEHPEVPPMRVIGEGVIPVGDSPSENSFFDLLLNKDEKDSVTDTGI